MGLGLCYSLCMDLSQVVLINYVDKTRLTAESPLLTVQKLVRLYADNGTESNATRVLSLSVRHWKLYDLLTGHYAVEPHVLFETAVKYIQTKKSHFDEAMEICLDLICDTLDINTEESKKHAREDVSEAVKAMAGAEQKAPSKTLH